MLVRVLYVSEISPGVTGNDIDRLVAHARRNNRQRDLTGALLACDGHFAQALEGQEAQVEEVMRKIAADPRHRELKVLERSVVTRRLFPDWDMAVIDDSRCGDQFHDLRAGRLVPDAFLDSMGAWIDERRLAPI